MHGHVSPPTHPPLISSPEMFPVSFRTCIPKLSIFGFLPPRVGPATLPVLPWAQESLLGILAWTTITIPKHIHQLNSEVSADVFTLWPGAGGGKQSCCHTQLLQGWKCSTFNNYHLNEVLSGKERTGSEPKLERDVSHLLSVQHLLSVHHILKCLPPPLPPAGPAPPPTPDEP